MPIIKNTPKPPEVGIQLNDEDDISDHSLDSYPSDFTCDSDASDFSKKSNTDASEEKPVRLFNKKRSIPFDYIKGYSEEDDANIYKPPEDQLEFKPMVTFDDGSTYVGQWNKITGKIHGEGTIEWNLTDGTKRRYKGQWKDHECHGKGIYNIGKETFYDGDIYEGGFYNHMFQGYGVWTYSDGSKYMGNWDKRSKNGQGKLIYSHGDEYEGGFVTDKFYGYAKFTWANGDIYEGNFSNNKMNGYGKIKMTNGERYKGYWKNNLMNGKGRYLQQDGTQLLGVWVEGLKQGKFTKIETNKPKSIVKYKDGDLI